MRKENIIAICLFLFFLIPGSIHFPAISQPTALPVFRMPENIGTDEYMPGKIIFKLREEARPQNKSGEIETASFRGLLREMQADPAERIFPYHAPPLKSFHASGQPYVDLSLIYKTRIPDDVSLEDAINRLYATGQIEYAQPWYIPQPLFEPDDPFIGSQYYLETIQAFDAWAIEQGDTNMVIAIIDTGIDLYHPDLINDIAYNHNDTINGEDSDNDGYIDNYYGWDLGENNNNPQYNVNAHGVHVAGIAGASTNNGTGMAGVGFNSRLLPIKISDADGRLVRAYEGIIYAADQGAQIINCSWGGAISPGQFGQDIINYAVLNRDAVVIAAAGNSNNQTRIYPASFANSLSIAATNSSDTKWENSSFGNLVDLSAPGSGIFSTWPNGNYISSSGTSMAAPVVAGAAALLRAHFPHYNALQIAAQLKVTTDIIDTIPANEPYAGLMGTGRLNLYRALTETHHPYITLVQLQHPREHYQLYNPGEAFPLAAEFKNLLATADNLTARISSTSPHVEILSDETLLGTIEHLDKVNNFEQPFSVRIKESIPPSHEVNFTISFYTGDGVFAGRQNFSIIFNLDYVDIEAGQLKTTFNSKGNIGFNYPNFNQGQGFVYNNANQNRTLIKSAGFVAGVSTSRVVDNIYGPMEDSFSDLLFSSENARLRDEPGLGDKLISGSFTDSLAGTSRVGIKVNYSIHAFEQEGKDKFLILEYDIINQSGDNLPGFYAGLFADWTLLDIRNHRASFNPEHQLGYAFSANGGNFTGIQLLSHTNVRHYAFDNQGFGSSIRINNGFTSFEKYTAMKSSRENAGFFDKDNDISTLIASGPFNVLPDDTLRLAFAMLAGDHINDILASAQLARSIYLGEDEVTFTEDIIGENPFGLSIFPNPARESVKIILAAPLPANTEYRVYDTKASLMHRGTIKPHQGGSAEISIDISGWPAGTYILQLRNDNTIQTRKFLKR